jgi:hypothetical protein
MPKNDRVAEFSVAGSNADDALIFGHLQRFKPYPLAAHGGVRHSDGAVRIESRGEVISSKVTIIRQPAPRSRGARDSPPRQSVSRLSRRQTLASRISTHAGSQGLATGRAWRICDDRSCKALRKSHRVAEIWRDLDRCR